jgi:hypothetical protein
MYSRTYSRRSGRILKSVPVILRWQTPSSDWEHAVAETRCLSRYGCTVLCGSRAKFGNEITVVDTERDRRVSARVVYRELTGNAARMTIALEFKDNSDFWQIDFPPPAGVDVPNA